MHLGLEKTQKSLSKKKRKSKKDDDDESDDNEEIDISKQKVLDWPSGNNSSGTSNNAPKKYRKGFQKKQNAQL